MPTNDPTDKGNVFLDLINKQNQTQQKIVYNLSSLIKSDWNSPTLRSTLESLLQEHNSLIQQINSLE